MQTFCTGPKYTFQGYERGPCTSIDNIIIDSSSPIGIENVTVLHDYNSDTSDHLLVLGSLITIETINQFTNQTEQSKVAWAKAVLQGRISDYKYTLSENLYTLDFNQTSIESYYIPVNAIKMAADNTLPNVKFCRYLKPYWSVKLSQLHGDMLKDRTNWINEKRPRSSQYQSYVAYKHLKNLFRNELRNANELHIRRLSEDIEKSVDVDQQLEWSIINGRRSTKSNDITLKSKEKVKIVSDKVCEEFVKHFEQIAQIREGTIVISNKKLL